MNTEFDTSGEWVCDGGDFKGTHDEVEQHVKSIGKFADGTLKPPSDVVCWGGLKVGSPAYEKWLDGVHPMEGLMSMVRNVAGQAQFAPLFRKDGDVP